MAKVTVSLDSDLAIEAVLLSGASSPQDAVELIVLDYLATGRPTEARTRDAADRHRLTEPERGPREG
jgi:hypothetical protein